MKKRFRNKILLFFFFLAAMYIIINIIKPPLSQTFEYIPDEGFNLMKSSLFLKGYLLYKEIWSDQPPLFTVILSYWLKLFGLSVYHGRILILIFSTILLWAFYQIIKIQLEYLSIFIFCSPLKSDIICLCLPS